MVRGLVGRISVMWYEVGVDDGDAGLGAPVPLVGYEVQANSAASGIVQDLILMGTVCSARNELVTGSVSKPTLPCEKMVGPPPPLGGGQRFRSCYRLCLVVMEMVSGLVIPSLGYFYPRVCPLAVRPP